ncbi:uncharacterized protein LOC5510750 isoform X1 [Nematostella vectensis]|uniref:uncharacterized protein LOC5510750 isoform X1 n=1 Tax=Nematostella vectensis TaxID=45351 RepID=UPI0013901E00|nr:uncharacterized protein LOC5510750 isoform X1 [Nematostella vectensis]XP_032235880.1 uncharacterized protein LOC5510750 isoform X1 [Nematostella vectensis]
MEMLTSIEVWIFVTVFSVLLILTLLVNGVLLRLIFVALRHRLRHPRLRHFLASLASANLIASFVNLPLCLYALIKSEVRNTDEITKTTSDVYYYSFDVFYAVLCILHINMLMTERLFAVGWPIHHRIAPEMPDYVISVGIWLAAVLISTASYLVYNHTDFQHLSFVILISCIAVPTLVAMLLFACILASSNRRNRTMALNNDFSLSVLIAIMLGAFTVTCLPLHCVNYLSYFCKDCGLTEPYYVIMMSLRSLQYSCGVFTPAVALFGVTELRRNMSWCCFTCCAVDEDSNNDLYHMEVPGMLRAAPGSQCMLTRVTPAVSTENIQLSFHEQKVETK